MRAIIRLVILAISIAISITSIGLGLALALAQTNSLTIGAFTIDATGAPTLTVKPPTRAGTLAITADILNTAPAVNVIAGSVTLVNGQAVANFPAQSVPPICIAIDTTAASPVRRQAVTTASVTFEGITNHVIEYVCAPKNN